MGSETYWIGKRVKLHHLIQQHPDWSLGTYARVIGHDHKWVERWKARPHIAPSPLTLDAFKSRSHVAKRLVTGEQTSGDTHIRQQRGQSSKSGQTQVHQVEAAQTEQVRQQRRVADLQQRLESAYTER